jgi:hypothetical protein
MATRTITTDDITGEEVTGTVHKVKILTETLEVSEATETALKALAGGDMTSFYAYIAPYVIKAANNGEKLDTAVVRQWGLAQVNEDGTKVFADLKDRGRVGAEVFAAYRLAN